MERGILINVASHSATRRVERWSALRTWSHAGAALGARALEQALVGVGLSVVAANGVELPGTAAGARRLGRQEGRWCGVGDGGCQAQAHHAGHAGREQDATGNSHGLQK